MPRQNRVTPFGDLVAVPARGTLMGNRGCLHDAGGRIRRAFAGRRWIACELAFKGRRRPVMAPGRYTELFFLDEATALAAGHRPCAECRRARFRLFQTAWAAADPDRPLPTAGEIDRVLHAERVGPGGRQRTHVAAVGSLPDGVMVADAAGVPYLVAGGAVRVWAPAGYGPPEPAPACEVRVLTPPAVVRAIAAGYPVGAHPSAGENVLPAG